MISPTTSYLIELWPVVQQFVRKLKNRMISRYNLLPRIPWQYAEGYYGPHSNTGIAAVNSFAFKAEQKSPPKPFSRK